MVACGQIAHYHDGMANSVNREQVRLAKEALLGRLVPDLIHQLRNPLNSILTGAELLEENGDSPKLRETIVPVVSRSATRIRDLLSGLDSALETSVPRGFEVRAALREAGELLQCRRHTVEIVGACEGERYEVDGPYDALWVLLLSIYEQCLCNAQESLRISLAAESEGVSIHFVHDGTVGPVNSGSPQEFILELARSLDADVYYVEHESAVVLRFRENVRLVSKVQK